MSQENLRFVKIDLLRLELAMPLWNWIGSLTVFMRRMRCNNETIAAMWNSSHDFLQLDRTKVRSWIENMQGSTQPYGTSIALKGS